jgi:hypothetical protein
LWFVEANFDGCFPVSKMTWGRQAESIQAGPRVWRPQAACGLKTIHRHWEWPAMETKSEGRKKTLMRPEEIFRQ